MLSKLDETRKERIKGRRASSVLIKKVGGGKQGFQIYPAPGASHRLLQALAPGTFRIPNFINYTVLFHQVIMI